MLENERSWSPARTTFDSGASSAPAPLAWLAFPIFAACLALAPAPGTTADVDEPVPFLVDDEFLPAPLTGAGSAADETLSPDDISTIVRVEDYLNQLGSVRSRFVQLSSEGDYAANLRNLY